MTNYYLYCRECETEASADPADYWASEDGVGFECTCVDSLPPQPMALVERHGRFHGDRLIASAVTVGLLRKIEARYRKRG